MSNNFHTLNTEEADQDVLEQDMLNVKNMLELDGDGNTRIKSAVGQKIQFYNGNSQQFSSIDIKTLTDNIVISSSLNLNNMNTLINTNSSKNTYPSADATKVGHINVSQAVDLDTMESNIATNNAKVGISTSQSNAITANSNKNSYPSADAAKLAHINVSQAVDLDTMESNISTNNSKVGITTTQSNNINSNNAKISYNNTDSTKVGFISCTQAVDLDTMESNIATNNAKVGISTSQANAITANSAKVGISTSQANAITANTAKDGITSSQISDIAAAKAELLNINIQSSVLLYNFFRMGSLDSESQSFIIQHSNLNSSTLASTHGSLIVDNSGNLKLNAPTSRSISFRINNVEQFNNSEVKNLVDNISVSQAVNLDTMESNIATNNDKTGITSSQASAITANTAKTGITSSQASAIVANTAKTGITSSQATDIANNKTELNNIIIGTDVLNYSTGRIGKVDGTTGFSIMNSSLNSGVLNDTYAGLKQSNQGKTILNGVTSDPISFRKNNVEEYTGNDLKNLVDNISVSQAVNLDTMESNIATNNAKAGITSTEQDTLSYLSRSSSNTKVNVASGTGFSVYLNEIECRGANVANPANANIYMTTKQGSLPGYSTKYYPTLKTDYTNLYFSANGIYSGYIGGASVGRIDFTGQHRCVPVNDNLITNLNNHVGKIVISSGEICSLIKNDLNIFNPTTGKEGITINESIPKVLLSNTYKDKRVFGIISDGLDSEENGEKHYKFGSFTSVIHSEVNDNRLTINSVGEGAILVCNICGNFENGDLITTSTVEGIGCRQDNDLIHSYTVAKSTINCDFDLNSNKYNCYLDENGNKIALISCIYLL